MFFISTHNHLEIKRIFAFGLAIILLLALISFQINDLPSSKTPDMANWIGGSVILFPIIVFIYLG